GAVGIICTCTGILLAVLALACGAAAGRELVFDVVAHGARGDGATDDTKVRDVSGGLTRRRVLTFNSVSFLWFLALKQAFEAAWAAACGARGPSASMVVPARRSFLVGPVSFKGPCASARITVQILGKIMAPPATAKAWRSGGNKHQQWLMFYRVDGLRVTGNGVLDGNGQSWWIRRCSDIALKLVGCNNLELGGFSSKDSPQMHIAILESSGVNVWGLTITAPGNSPNTDGIHVGRSQNVRITSSRIGTGDDGISISSGSRFVTVDGVQCGPGHGVSIGSLGKNGAAAAVEYVDVKNVHFTNTMNGARIKTWEGGRGYARSISFTNMEFDNVDNPVLIDQFYTASTSKIPISATKCILLINSSVTCGQLGVAISNITYTNLRGTSSRPTAVSFVCGGGGGGGCRDIHVNSMVITGSGGRRTVALCRNAKVATSGHVYPQIPCS
ncbi:hypothetical protein U9M48_033468, partial [Paspalum notatum var. saurae]